MMDVASDDSINALVQSWEYYKKNKDTNILKIHINDVSNWKVNQWVLKVLYSEFWSFANLIK